MGETSLVPTLRLTNKVEARPERGEEVFALGFTPDSKFVLSGGWDGQLRLWEAASGTMVSAFAASRKCIAACAVSPDGNTWLSGDLDGQLATWDATTQRRISAFAAHTRPIAGIIFGVDGRTLVTASWDRNIIVWDLARQHDGRTLAGHEDIVAGCRLTPNGQTLVSWSHDHSIRIWDVLRAKHQQTLVGHTDRVTAGAVSPDGRWSATGSRDQTLKLWDLNLGMEAASVALAAEVRGCAFLLDGETLLAVDAKGRLTLHSVPELHECAELQTQLPVQCAELAPSGAQLAMGGEDGGVYFVTLEGFDRKPLMVMATTNVERTSTKLQRLFGKSTVTETYEATCPVCRQSLTFTDSDAEQSCSACGRQLRVHLAPEVP